jgi:hypothetical protein
MIATQQVWENNEMRFRQGRVDCGIDLHKVVVASYAKSFYDSL